MKTKADCEARPLTNGRGGLIVGARWSNVHPQALPNGPRLGQRCSLRWAGQR